MGSFYCWTTENNLAGLIMEGRDGGNFTTNWEFKKEGKEVIIKGPEGELLLDTTFPLNNIYCIVVSCIAS